MDSSEELATMMMILNNTTNVTDDRVVESEIKFIRDIGVTASAISIIFNGFLFLCILLNRKKPWIKSRKELSSIVWLDLVIGLFVVVIFTIRLTATGNSIMLPEHIEHGIYFSSKCLTINHLLLICYQKIQRIRQGNNLAIEISSICHQSVVIWIITISWLVLPFILLSNECSIVSFMGCTSLNGENLPIVLWFLALISGLPLGLVHIFLCIFIVLVRIKKHGNEGGHAKQRNRSIKWKGNKKRHLFTKLINKSSNTIPSGSMKASERISMGANQDQCSSLRGNNGGRCTPQVFVHSTEKSSLEDNQEQLILPELVISPERPSTGNTLGDEINNHGTRSNLTHWGSFSDWQQGQLERNKGEGWENGLAVTMTLLLFVLDVSIFPMVCSLVEVWNHRELPLAKMVYVVTFLTQIANPLIYILTTPHLLGYLKNGYALKCKSISSRRNKSTTRRDLKKQSYGFLPRISVSSPF